MRTIHKINFDSKDYDNVLIYDDSSKKNNKENTSFFQMPESIDFLTVFVLLEQFNDNIHAQLVNCISSLKVQTFINIKTVIVNFDNSINAKTTVKKLAESTNSSLITITEKNVGLAIDAIVKDCQSKYISIINYSDLIPRIRDIEFVTKNLFENDYDFITLTVKYFDTHGTLFNFENSNKSILKSNSNFHYSAYFKTSVLKQYSFSELEQTNIDEKMAVMFEQNDKTGNHISSRTQMVLLEKLQTNH